MIQGRMKTLVAAASLIMGFQVQAATDVQSVPGEYVVKMKKNISTLTTQDLGNILGGEVVR